MHWNRLLSLSLFLYCCNAAVFDPHVIRMTQNQDHEDGPTRSVVKFSFAKHFQDNMVLQRAPKRARVYGFSPDIGAKVIAQMTVTPEVKYYYTTFVVQGPAPGVGSWVLTLDPMNVTDPVYIKVSSEAGSLSLQNVLFGDVWLCSGQSNMEFTVPQMFKGAQEAADAHKYPKIRLLTISEAQSTTPLYDFEGIEEKWSLPSNVTVSHGAWKYFSAVCWLYGKHIYETVGYPIGLVATDWGGTPVEAWSSPDALAKCHVKAPHASSLDNVGVGGPQGNSVLWNAMIYPLLGTTIYGAIWYQGEDDSYAPERINRYNCTFPAMIDDWRIKFTKASKGETSNSFPFGFVQLSANRPNPNITVGFPDIRWHQTADYGYVPNPRMPNTFMAVAMDLPDFKSTYGSIHPRDKEDVGTRLALAGLAVAYNQTEQFQGPFPITGQVFPPFSLVLDYGQQWNLKVNNVTGFELSCKPSNTNQPLVWHGVPITVYNATSVSIFSNVCPGGKLYALRYSWRESPCAFKLCAVYSTTNSLPAPPFLSYFESGKNGNAILRF